jgi:hypothetical protein
MNPTIQNVVPSAARETLLKSLNDAFQSALKLPRGMNRGMISRAVDRVILEKIPVEELGMGLLRREREYIAKVVEEFRSWEAINQSEPPEGSDASEDI